jgi:acetyl-CoA carboxylase carboxyl transferase subunit beta
MVRTATGTADRARPYPLIRPILRPGLGTCEACGARHLEERFERALRVCPACGHHGRVPAPVRVEQLADPGTAEPIAALVPERDPLHFDDGTAYPDRLRAAREMTGQSEAMLIARASLGGTAVVIASMEFDFLGGSLGSAAGALFSGGCEVAVAEHRALVAVCTSGGARMQEGIVALAQMARCTAAVAAVADAGLPYLAVLADPCFGGVTASFAAQADVILAEPGARIGFAGGRVIEQAARDQLPDGFQKAEFLLAHGMVDAVVSRTELSPTLTTLLRAYGGRCIRIPA